MPAKMSRSALRPPFRLREVSIAVRTWRLSCRKAGKARMCAASSGVIWKSRLERRQQRRFSCPRALLEGWILAVRATESLGERNTLQHPPSSEYALAGHVARCYSQPFMAPPAYAGAAWVRFYLPIEATIRLGHRNIQYRCAKLTLESGLVFRFGVGATLLRRRLLRLALPACTSHHCRTLSSGSVGIVASKRGRQRCADKSKAANSKVVFSSMSSPRSLFRL